MTLRAIANHVIFVFEDNFQMKTVEGKSKKLFTEETDWGFKTSSAADTINTPRWGITLAVGPLCDKDIQPGMRVLIEPLKWTNGVQMGEDWFWRTDDVSIMMIDEDFVIEKKQAA